MHFDTNSPAQVSASFETTAPGAAVFIDYADVPAGVTPLAVSNLAPGWHTAVLRKEGYLGLPPIRFEARGHPPVDVVLTLTPASNASPITAEVRSVPPDAEVYVDYLPVTNRGSLHVIGLSSR